MARDPGRTLQTARLIPISASRRTFRDRLTNSDTTDIWRFRTTARSSLNLVLNGLARGSNANLALLNNRGAGLRNAARPGNQAERVTDFQLAPGTYYVRVQRQRGSANTRYALSLSATPTNDRFGNSFETATPLPAIPQGAQTGTLSDFVGDRDPSDFFSFGTLVAGRMNLDLVGLSDDANLELYDGDRKLLFAARNTGNANERLSERLTGISGSAYFLRITAPPGRNTNYTLNYSFAFDQPTRTASGLQFIDLAPGSGELPRSGQTLRVAYTGVFLNGRVFDTSRAPNRSPFTFTLGRREVIAGWDEGLSTMRVGGRRQLIVPANLAYGERGTRTIPPNSTLIFDVELLGIS